MGVCKGAFSRKNKSDLPCKGMFERMRIPPDHKCKSHSGVSETYTKYHNLEATYCEDPCGILDIRKLQCLLCSFTKNGKPMPRRHTMLLTLYIQLRAIDEHQLHGSAESYNMMITYLIEFTKWYDISSGKKSSGPAVSLITLPSTTVLLLVSICHGCGLHSSFRMWKLVCSCPHHHISEETTLRRNARFVQSKMVFSL